MADAKKPLNADLDLPPEIRAKLANYEAMEAKAARADAMEAESKRLKQQLADHASADTVSTDENGARQYKHQIDLPPVGGYGLKINGSDYFHGQVYAFSENQMRDVLEMEYRCWAHERSIRGSNENAYRRPAAQRFSGGVVNTRRSLMG